MKVYRNHYTDESGESMGFDFFLTKEEAVEAFRAGQPGLDDESSGAVCAEAIEFRLTRIGAVRALNKLAGHPNNG